MLRRSNLGGPQQIPCLFDRSRMPGDVAPSHRRLEIGAEQRGKPLGLVQRLRTGEAGRDELDESVAIDVVRHGAIAAKRRQLADGGQQRRI
jgi:hypothetical protein